MYKRQLHPTLTVLKTSSDLIVIWMTLDRCRTLSKIDQMPLAARQRPPAILAQFLVILAVSFLVSTPFYFEYDVIPAQSGTNVNETMVRSYMYHPHIPGI